MLLVFFALSFAASGVSAVSPPLSPYEFVHGRPSLHNSSTYELAKKMTADELAVGLGQYGNWCGGDHGGYSHCCGGNPCPACNASAPDLSKMCLQECRPIDDLDLQCAFHDHCTYQQDFAASPINPNPRAIPCTPQGNFCACDCIIKWRASKVNCELPGCGSEVAEMEAGFGHALACVYFDSENAGQLTCDGVWSGKKYLEEFCPTGSLGPIALDGANGCLPDASPANGYCNKGNSMCYDGYEADPLTGTCIEKHRQQ
eukprot:TRINITY_DN14156_c0_g1_i1.p1 TRINITY_DN14156_c0_g1~~TRINITY_DN14156_c0_g1_i1.p1  ORF type:complete len:271 (-),score=11.53 TRINITY_DN14156_c0_g1_i1:25-798(-)